MPRRLCRVLWQWGKVVGLWAATLLVCHTLVSNVVWTSVRRNTLISQLSTSPQWLEHFRTRDHLDCSAYLEGDKDKIKSALELQTVHDGRVIPDEKFIEITKDCGEYIKYRGYRSAISKEEQNFSIAFSILLYKEAEQAERLLRLIYRPQNLYCIHVDGNSSPVLHKAMQAVANCFENVFISSKTESIVYAGFSRLMADINCMRDLLARGATWKYFLNLPSQAFPLKTNAELVKILKIYNGSNDIEGITGNRRLSSRYANKYEVKKDPKSGLSSLVRTNEKKAPPPHNVTVVKGSAYGVFSRAFVEFILSDRKAQDLLKWLEDVYSPDEYFWATLNHLQHNGQLNTPGGYKGPPMKKAWLATYAAWRPMDPCHGKWVHGACVFGLEDIQYLVSRKELFANKFHIGFHSFALYCMERWIENKTKSHLPTDLYFYRQLDFTAK